MFEKLVGVETFTEARKEKPDNATGPTGFYSRVIARPGSRQMSMELPAPWGVPMANLFVRPIDPSNPHEAVLFEGEKARRLRRSFEVNDDALKESLSQLIIPKVGPDTLARAIDTMFALDQKVSDLVLALHAQNLFASSERDPRSMVGAASRYISAIEFQTPVRRARDAASQESPLLEMKIWSPKSVEAQVKELILTPVMKGVQTVKLRRKIGDLEKGMRDAAIRGEDEKREALVAQLAESQEKMRSLEGGSARKHLLTRLIESLATDGISVEVNIDRDQRRATPDGQIIIGDPKGVRPEGHLFNAYRITFKFPISEQFDVYLNEFVLGSNGMRRMKDTVLHHIEQLRTDEFERVASLFCRLEYPDMADYEHNQLVAEVQRYARIEERDRALYSRPLSPEATQVYSVIERYLQVNTIRPQTAFKTKEAWASEFSK